MIHFVVTVFLCHILDICIYVLEIYYLIPSKVPADVVGIF